MSGKILETNRLYLRKFTLDDIDEVVYCCNDYEIHKNTSLLPYPYKEEHARFWIEANLKAFENAEDYTFAVIRKEDDKLIGCVGLSNDVMQSNGELGYWFGRDYWHKGYATEAAKAVVDWAFNEKDYHRVHARHLIYNRPSGRVMEKIGMTFEGIQKDHVRKLNDYIDTVLYGIVKRDK